MAVPTHLRVEHLDDAMGITVAAPRLSWQLPPGARHQNAYRVRAGEWDSGRVVSERSLLVPYAGPSLRSGERVEWTVKVWTDQGESDWAEPGWWEMGLLNPSDWVSTWVEPVSTEPVPDGAPYPVWLLRGGATLDSAIEHARLYVTAHGIYEFFINGNRVGDRELTPGFTSYRSTLQVQAYDVTGLMCAGENVLGAVLSGGWVKWAQLYRDMPLGLLAQLHVYGADGSVTTFGTGPEWVATTGAIQSADLRQGQVADLRKDLPGWCTPGAELQHWSAVRVHEPDVERLVGSPAPPVRGVEELKPVAISRPRPDRQVVDLGQNINGWVRLTNLGPAGTELTLTHGETLDPAGDVTVEHIRADPELPFQQDRVVSAGVPGATFEPRHATRGFRYVRVEGHPGELSADDITGVVVHTDMRRTGWFECSNERLNRLHDAAVWGFRDNACDIPTDCPTRERVGWTGDWQIFVPTAAFVYDVAGLSAKWLRDLATDQRADGVVWHCAPNPEHPDFYEDFPPGSAGWGDAAVIVPWEIYRAYGDRDLLEQQWTSMTAWVERAARIARERRHDSRVASRPVPATHEEFLWDTGFNWGEWLEPDMLDRDPEVDTIHAYVRNAHTADQAYIATAYLHYSARLLAQIATVLRRDAETVRRYRRLAAGARRAWQQEFLHSDGALSPHTQSNYVRALAFDLVPEELRPQVCEHLVDLIRKADTHVGTGFLATPYILPVLADNGHTDLAYELLLQDTEPSWLTMIERGATTIWEHWTGLDETGQPGAPPGVGSLNNYSKGAVVSFLHRYVAGIQLLSEAPAYRRFRIEPRPGGGITSARASHESPYGWIESSWHLADDEFILDVTVPPGSSAQVCLPDGRTFEARPGSARFGCKVAAASL